MGLSSIGLDGPDGAPGLENPATGRSQNDKEKG